MHRLVIGTLVDTPAHTRALVRSLRAFGGALAKIPVHVIVPAEGDGLPAALSDDLAAVGAQIVPAAIPSAALQFPLAAKVFAAAELERQVDGTADCLAWLDADTLFIREPAALLLPEGKQAGYSPVHHRLIGPLFDMPLDSFWTLVYARCGVSPDRIFPMRTVVDDEMIWPYINAGSLVVRPAAGLLRAWRDRFAAEYRDLRWQPFYNQHILYRVFMHQAILSAELVARLDPSEWIDLPRTYNYPLHLYNSDDPSRRPASINDLVTCRYEDVFTRDGWHEKLPIADPLAVWIAAEFTNHDGLGKGDSGEG